MWRGARVRRHAPFLVVCGTLIALAAGVVLASWSRPPLRYALPIVVTLAALAVMALAWAARGSRPHAQTLASVLFAASALVFVFFCAFMAGELLDPPPKDAPALSATDLLTGILVSIGFLAAGIALQTHHWDQRNRAIEYSDKWIELRKEREVLAPHITPDRRLGGGLREQWMGRDAGPWSAGPWKDETEPAIRSVLTHLEIVSAGIDKNVFAPDVMYPLYGHNIVNYYFCLEDIIKGQYRAEDRSGLVFPSLEKQAARWLPRVEADEKAEEARKRDAGEAFKNFVGPRRPF